MAVVRFRVGAPGSGKTFSLVHEILNEWATGTAGAVWTNLPLNIAEMDAYCLARNIICPEIHLIPEDDLNRWMDEKSGFGPWEYFSDKDLGGSWIIIDEVHNFISTKHPRPLIEKWKKWLGEIRHTGAIIDFVSQDESKVAKAIRDHAPVRIELLNAEDRRDPFFKIKLFDWYQLRSKWSGSWNPCIWRLEAQKVFGRWKSIKEDKIWLDDTIYALYNSYAAPTSGHGKSGKQPLPWELFTWPQLLRWFFKANWWSFASRFCLVAVFLWVCFFGGFTLFMDWMTGSFTGKIAKAPASAPLDVANAQTVTKTDKTGNPVQEKIEYPRLIGSGNGLAVVQYQGQKQHLKEGKTCFGITANKINAEGVWYFCGQSFLLWPRGAILHPDMTADPLKLRP